MELKGFKLAPTPAPFTGLGQKLHDAVESVKEVAVEMFDEIKEAVIPVSMETEFASPLAEEPAADVAVEAPAVVEVPAEATPAAE